MSLGASSSNITLPSSSFAYENISSATPAIYECFDEPAGSVVFTTFTVANVLFVLPMCSLILWMGVRHQCRSSGAAASNVFVFYMVTTEVVSILGTVLLWTSSYMHDRRLRMAGYLIFVAIYPAQQGFHCLTCVERYVAVVHPITYLSLRASSGLRLRHISCWVVCLVCLGFLGLAWLVFPQVPTIMFCVTLFLTIMVVSFCSLAVLHNLLHPKVGSEGIDQSKLRAFYSILLITGTLVLRSSGLLIMTILSNDSPQSEVCVAIMFGNWLCFPSIVIVPLLYLHKEGALTWLSCSSKPGGT